MNAGAAGAGSGGCAAPKYRYTAPLSDAPRAGPGACDPGSRLVARRGRQEPRSTAVPLPGDTQGWYVRTRRSRRHCSPSAGPLLLLARAPPAPSLSVYPAARAPRHRAELRHQELEERAEPEQDQVRTAPPPACPADSPPSTMQPRITVAVPRSHPPPRAASIWSRTRTTTPAGR